MATITWYLTNNSTSVGSDLSTTDPGTEAYRSPVTGWIVGTGSTNHSEYFNDVERASSTFTGTTVPDGSLDTTNGDFWVSPTRLTGSFAAANWNIHCAVRANTGGDTQDGRIRIRLFRGPNQNGTGATEITAAQQLGGLVTNLLTTATQVSTVTWNPGAFSVANEYIFVQLAWERTGAAGMTTYDVNIRIGNGSGNGSRVITADFTETFPAVAEQTESISSPQYVRLTAIHPVPNLLATTLLALAPFAQTDWTSAAVQQMPFQSAPQAVNLLTSLLAVEAVVPDGDGPKVVFRKPLYVRAQPKGFADVFEPPNLLSSTLGDVVVVAAPFSQTDWPEVGTRYSAITINPPNLLVTTLGTPAEQAPFAQELWPSAPQQQEQRFAPAISSLLVGTLQQPSIAASFLPTPYRFNVQVPPAQNTTAILRTTPAGYAPFEQTDWTTVGGKSISPAPQAQNTLAALRNAPAGYAPFQQEDWGVVGYKYSPYATYIPNLLTNTLIPVVVGVPFEQTDWTTVGGKSISPAPQAQNTLAALRNAPAGYAPFEQTDWTTVGAKASPVAQPVPNLLGTTLAVIAGAPFEQLDWTTVGGKSISPAPQAQNTLAALRNAPAGYAPFEQTDWTTVGAKASPVAQPAPNLLGTTLATAPFEQSDWTTVGAKGISPAPQAANLLETTLSQPPIARALEGPQQRKSVVSEVVENTLLILRDAAAGYSPFAQDDWTQAPRQRFFQPVPATQASKPFPLAGTVSLAPIAGEVIIEGGTPSVIQTVPHRPHRPSLRPIRDGYILVEGVESKGEIGRPTVHGTHEPLEGIPGIAFVSGVETQSESGAAAYGSGRATPGSLRPVLGSAGTVVIHAAACAVVQGFDCTARYGKVKAHGEGRAQVGSFMTKGSVGEALAYGITNPTEVEVVALIAAIRKARAKRS